MEGARIGNPLKTRLLAGELLLLDGAMGTELERRGVRTPLPLWSARALLDAPDLVRSIHEDHIRAGADIVTTCTFRTTPRALAKAGLAGESDRWTARAAAIAREAVERSRGSRAVLIAGAIAPLEDCYRPDLAPPPEQAEQEHADQAIRLGRAGVDLILIETMNTAAEARAAVRGAKSSGLPVVASFICRSGRELLDGTPLEAGVRAVEPFKPDAVLVNCVPPEMALECLVELARSTNLPTGCYPNVGHPEMGAGTWTFDNSWSPDRLAEVAGTWVARGAQIVGGCCGTTPDHIRALRAALPPVVIE